MQTDNLPASEGQGKGYGTGKELGQSSIDNGEQSVEVRKKGSQDRGNGEGIDGNSKSRTRYNSTKYRTIKAVPNSSIVKRVQRLYTEGAAQSSAQKHPKTTLDRQSYNPASKISLSFSSNPILVDLNPTLPQGQPQSKPNPKASYNKNHPPYSTKQQMYEQNMHLKNLINELKDELSRQKIQTELQKKKNKRYTNVLNREFKKELYYQGKLAQGERACEEEVEKIAKLYNNSDQSENDSPEKQSGPYSDVMPFGDRKQYESNYKRYKMLLRTQLISPERSPSPTNIRSSEYMIAGIKQKYEELKNEHQRVLRELEKYKNVDSVQKLQELSIYCMALEENNRKLADGLSSCKFKLAAYENGKQQNQMYQSALTIQLNGKIAALKSKNGTLRQQNKRMKEQNKEHSKLIRYLETIIIQKQNKQRRSSKAIKKVNAILEHLQEELNKEKEENKQLKQVSLEEMQKLSMKNHEEIQGQRQVFEETLMEKNMEIRKLEKEMGYMATIIQNWKLGEEKQTIVSNADNTARRRKESSVTGKEIGQKLVFEDKGPDSLGPLSTISEKKELEKQYHSKVTSSNRKPSTQNESNTKAQDKEKKTKASVQKKRKTSAVKRSENAKKQRKVNLEQVIDLPEYIRYRLIGLNLSIDQACKYFDYRPPAEERKDKTESEEEDSVDHEEAKELEKWKKMYINQAELTSTLIQEPFKLRPEDAVLLARYIIEDQQFYQNGDTTNAFVYSDFQNEIERTLTKSIMKAFIQTHSTNLLHPSGEGSLFHSCQKQWAKILEKSGVRINTPLISIAPGGTVTKERWNQLLGSIGMEIGENVKEWCIGRMLLESEGLGKLRYRAIVPEGL